MESAMHEVFNMRGGPWVRRGSMLSELMHVAVVPVCIHYYAAD